MPSYMLPPEILCKIASFIPDKDDNIKAQILCFAGYPYNDIVIAKTEKERCDAIARADAVLLCEPEDPRLKIHYFSRIPPLLESVAQHEAWGILNYMVYHVENWERLLFWYFAGLGKLELVKWCRPFCSQNDFTTAGHYHAAKSGHLHIIEWLADELNMELPIHEIIDAAARHGHLHILQWCFQKGYTDHFTTTTKYIAEEEGWRDIVAWLERHVHLSMPVWYDRMDGIDPPW